MSDKTGTVYDLGYKPYQGQRRGRTGALRAMWKDGLRRSFGIRRKARKKVYPFSMLVIVVLPAIVFVGFAFLADSFVPDFESPWGGHSQYIALVGVAIILFVASAAPNLLIPDREDGVLSVYSSRPMSATDYVWGRVGALVTVVAAFMIVGNLIMYIGFAGLDDDGFGSALISNADDMVKVLLVTVAYVAGYGAPALLVATYAKRIGPAAGTYLGAVIISSNFAEGFATLDIEGARFGTLISLVHHPEVVRNWVFGESQTAPVIDVGFEPWVSALAILFVSVLTIYLMIRRYRREL